MLLNGFSVSVPETIEVLVRPLEDPREVKGERQRLAEFWAVHWRDGQLWHLRLKAGGPNVEGVAKTIRGQQALGLIRARLEDVFAEVFSQYDPLRVRPFTFVAQKDEHDVFAEARRRVDMEKDERLDGFSITPRFSFHPKIVEIRPGESQIGLFIELSMRYEAVADLQTLQKFVDLSGAHIVHRVRPDEGRQLVGRIGRIEGDIVHLAQAFDQERVSAADVKLEGSKETFSRCLGAILGRNYPKLRDAIVEAEAGYRSGPALSGIINRWGLALQRKSPIALAQNVTVTVGSRLSLSNSVDMTNIYTVCPVEYVFQRSGEKRNEMAWRGLVSFGPYDQISFAKKSPRILVVFPESAQGKVEAFVHAMRSGISSARHFNSGFGKTFGLVNPEYLACPVPLRLGTHPEQSYRKATEEYLARDGAIDAAIVVILDEHSRLPDLISPYVRTKAMFLTLGIASQQIKYSTMAAYPAGLGYSLQNLCVALYAKLGGTPWTVDQDRAIADEVVIGMGTAELAQDRFEQRKRFVGITTVFSGDGTYVLGNTSREYSYEEYFPALRTSMIAILREIKTRNGWQPGDPVRIIFHAHKPLKRDEVAKIAIDCAREVGSEQILQIAFVTISHDHPFMLFDPDASGVADSKGNLKGVMAPDRGTIARIGSRTRLLATNSGSLIKRWSVPLPKPLLIGLHPDSTFVDIDYLAEQALKFTSLSWRSTLPGREPATIIYSERIAELLSRLRDVPDWSPAQLSVKLRYSRWFL